MTVITLWHFLKSCYVNITLYIHVSYLVQKIGESKKALINWTPLWQNSCTNIYAKEIITNL